MFKNLKRDEMTKAGKYIEDQVLSSDGHDSMAGRAQRALGSMVCSNQNRGQWGCRLGGRQT
jgi:hypothetical protein